MTKHRELILKNLQSRRDHPTAKMVYDSAKNSIDKMSFATVYNSLEYLVKAGYVRKVNVGQDSARFDAVLEPHSHLVCTECGNVWDIPSLKLADETGIDETNFDVQDISITVMGKCKDGCRESQNQSSENREMEVA